MGVVLSKPPDSRLLLQWYDRHRRSLPWRAEPHQTPDPYRVWLSEIMLQQTTVTAVIPYFHRFLTRFPTIEALAAAPDETVMAAWAGLGYYARARNLLACARKIVALGAFPATVDGLRDLPGIGVYTAAAIASIGFGIPVVPVDGNVERVVSRLFAIETPLPAGKKQIATLAPLLGAQDAARERPADFTQALFDLGAGICTPTSPNCLICPWQKACMARKHGLETTLPRRTPKAARPIRYGAHFYLQDADGHVLLRRRPPTGLFGGMTELPGTAWVDQAWLEDAAIDAAPAVAAWKPAGQVRHILTHFELRIDVYAAQVRKINPMEGFLHPAHLLEDEALASVMRRCVELGHAALRAPVC